MSPASKDFLDANAIVIMTAGYIHLGIILVLVGCIAPKWFYKPRSVEGAFVAKSIAILLVSLWLPLLLWRGIKFLGRGFRDLLPERKAKLPKARVYER